MNFFKYLFLLLIFISFDLHAYCAHPAYSYGTTRLNPVPSTACYPEVNGSGFCKFKVEGSSHYLDSTDPNLAPYTTFTVSSISSRVYRNSDCTVILQEGCTQSSDGSIQCEEEEEEEEENDPVLQCSTDSCPNPENKRCPAGYTSGSFNGQNICAKSNKPEEPEPCDGENCESDQDVINAVNNANYSITGAIDNLKNSFSNSLNQIKNLLGEISQKIQNLGNSNGGGDGDGYGDGYGEVDTSELSAETPFSDTEQHYLNENLFSSNDQCPADNVLNLNFMGNNITYNFSYAEICNALYSLSFIVMILAYMISIYIVSRE
jgi:hypothetical protein